MAAGREGSAYAARPSPWWRSPWLLLALVALPVLWWLWKPSGVELVVNPALLPDEACELGFSEVPRLPGAKVEVALDWLPGGTLHVVQRLHRGDVDETELWFWAEGDGEPVVRAAFRTRHPGGQVSEASGVHGTVALQRPLDEDLRARRLLEPLTLSFLLRGEQWDTEQRARWKLHLPASTD